MRVPDLIPRRRGSVIIVVLLTIAFASLLLLRLIESSSTEMLIAVRAADRERLRADAHAALETTLAALQDFRVVDGALHSPAQGWSEPLTYAGYIPREDVEIAVSFEDESAKLSLPRMTLDGMNLLLVQLGLHPNDAARVADALFVWMHPGYVAAETATSATAYVQSDPPHLPPQRPLRSFDELAAVAVARDFFYDQDGVPTQLWHDFARTVSLYSFNGTNLNSASMDVLIASGWDLTQSDLLAQYLATPGAGQTPRYFRSMQEARAVAGNPAGENLGAEIRCLRVIVDVRQRAARYRLSALVSPGGQARLSPPISGAVAGEGEVAAAAEGQPPAQQQRQPQPTQRGESGGRSADANTAGNTLQYPFTVLELIESAVPEPSTNDPQA